MTDAGFAVIPIWLLRDPSVDEKAKMLYLHLSSRVDVNGSCWPSQARLADELGVDVRTVRRHLTMLREAGLVEVTTRTTPTGRRNTYRLLTDRFGGAGVRTPAPAPAGGGEDTDVLMGEDTSVLRTRATRTTSSESTSPEVETPRATGAIPVVEPEVHPSRPIAAFWNPRPVWARYLMHLYPGIDLRESCVRFVAFHIARQDTSRSWESTLQVWASQDWERMRERSSGTDDLGTPKGQRARTASAAQPGDPDYLDPEEVHTAARPSVSD